MGNPTPGDWSLEQLPDGDYWLYADNDAGMRTHIARLNGGWPDAASNAHLLCAAKDLRGVVDAFVKACVQAGVAGGADSLEPLQAILYRGQAALARARGEAR